VYSYPPSLDVYRKSEGETKTTTTVTSMTRTSTMTSTTTSWNLDGLWQHVGSCVVDGLCAMSLRQGDAGCTLSLPVGTPVKVVAFSGPNGEDLKINGRALEAEDVDQTIVLQESEISWSGSFGSGAWELCITTASCSDGLSVAAVDSAECPSADELAGLAGCQVAGPGALCLGDGECLTYAGLNNCPPMAVYRKQAGTTRTSTSVTSTTTTLTPSVWLVSGPCTVSGPCAQSPNFPQPYGPDERCELSLPPGSQVVVTTFRTEANYDKLTIGGQSYSGEGREIQGQTLTVTGPITWRSDESESAGGWQLCLRAPRRLAEAGPSDGFEGPVMI